MPRLFRFGDFEVDVSSGEVRRRGVPVHLREQSFQVLAALLEHHGHVVSREQLRHRLWPDDVFVDFENNLNSAVAKLREALGDPADAVRFIETVPKRGYRLNVEVSEAVDESERPCGKPPRLVVLPFVNLSGDPGEEVFSDAMTEELITELSALTAGHLGVIARTTAMHYKGTQKDVACIARELSVDYLVEGGVRRQSGRVAVTVQLIRAGDQTHLFARHYETTLESVFDLRTTIAEAVGGRLAIPALGDAVRTRLPFARVKRKPTHDPAAYNEYIQGRYLLRQAAAPDAFVKAKAHFEGALARDPDFAEALDGLAQFYTVLGYFGVIRPLDAFSAGIRHARRAVEIDDGLADSHASLAEYHKQLDYDWRAAEREIGKALDLDPTSPIVRYRHAVAVLMPRGRVEEAVAELRVALDTNPLDRVTHTWLACMFLLARDYEAAVDESRRLLEIQPDSSWAHFFNGVACRQVHVEEVTGRRSRPASMKSLDLPEEAVRAHLRALELSTGTYFLGWLGLAYGACGRPAEARAVLERLRHAEGYVLPSGLAHTYLGLGEVDAAFEWFDRAVDERDQQMMPILSYAHYDAIRGDPRFGALLRKMNLT
jgi:TolB-like protein/tetratricopeptide (TPR) repeat protein